MAKYLLFAGEYDPKGGWEDYQGRFQEREEAIAKGRGSLKSEADGDPGWFQVVEIESGNIVHAEGYSRSTHYDE